MSFPLHIIPAGVALALVAGAAPASAGKFQVAPTRVELRDSRPGQVTVRNQSKTPTRFHVKAYRWSESQDGEMKLSPSSEIVVYPSLFELAPGAIRPIRLAAAATAGPREKSYRVIVEELPSLRAGRPAGGTGIAIRTRMSIPVFLAPRSRQVRGAVTAALDAGRLSFAVENRGTVHFRTQSVRVLALRADGSTQLDRSQPGWYVLPGRRRRYQLELGANQCRAVDRLVIEAKSDGGTWRSEIPVDSVRCAR
jgi:fimbrial chaperone protein